MALSFCLSIVSLLLLSKKAPKNRGLWRRERDSNPCGRVPKRFSRPPRYDHFDIPPYMNCRVADFIGYSIFLEIFLEMRFYDAFGVPEKSVFTRLFCVFATDMLANFQDRLVMTASITLHKYDAQRASYLWSLQRRGSMSSLIESTSQHSPQAK